MSSIYRKGQGVVRGALIWALSVMGMFLLAGEGRCAGTAQELEEDINRSLAIYRQEEMALEDYLFTLAIPKKAVPLLIQRLEEDREASTRYSSAYGLLADKLKQFDGEIPRRVRREALELLVKTCEEADDKTALLYLSGFHALADQQIGDMAGRMKGRSDAQVQKVATELLERITREDPWKKQGVLDGLGGLIHGAMYDYEQWMKVRGRDKGGLTEADQTINVLIETAFIPVQLALDEHPNCLVTLDQRTLKIVGNRRFSLKDYRPNP